MKRIFALLCAAALVCALAACSGRTDDDPLASKSLQEVLDATLKDVPDLPMYEPVALDADTFEFSAFVPYEDGFEAINADALMMSVPHSVVLIRVPADKAEKVAAAVKQNADPRKWICAEAEKVVVDRCGGTILLAMTAGETANAILTNFKALYGATPTEDELALPEPAFPAEDDFGGTEVVTAPDPEAHVDNSDLSMAMGAILCDAVNEEIPLMEMELNEENFEFYAFMPYEAGYRGLASEAMNGSIAYSVVLVEAPTVELAAVASDEMRVNADPRKWICVEAETVRSACHGKYALLVMTSPDHADVDKIFANFEALDQ